MPSAIPVFAAANSRSQIQIPASVSAINAVIPIPNPLSHEKSRIADPVANDESRTKIQRLIFKISVTRTGRRKCRRA